MAWHGGMIALLVFFLIFLILAGVFIGLYLRTRSLYVTCQQNLTGFTCPACPATGTCPPCPSTGTTGYGRSRVMAAGASKAEKLVMACGVPGATIQRYQVWTKVVDGGCGEQGDPEDITSYVNAQGQSNFSQSSMSILEAAGIDPQVPYSRRQAVYPSRILYGEFVCSA